MIAPAPKFPVIVVGPVAVSATALAANVPASSLVTVFTKVKIGEMSLSLMVQVAVWPSVNARLLPVKVPAVQLQELAL